MKKSNIIKTILSVCILCLAFSFNASAYHKVILHRSMSADGIHYDKVNESHTNTLFGHTDELDCHGKGHILCSWTTPPKIANGKVTTAEIESYVAREISNGNNSGAVNYNGVAHVKWVYNPDRDDLVITIDDNMGIPIPQL